MQINKQQQAKKRRHREISKFSYIRDRVHAGQSLRMILDRNFQPAIAGVVTSASPELPYKGTEPLYRVATNSLTYQKIF